METVLDENKEIGDLFAEEKHTLIQQQLLVIKLLRQEVRGLKAMLNQYKRDYKKLLEERI